MRKRDARRAKGVLGRVAAAGLTAALALGVAASAPASAVALEATPGGTVTTSDGVTLTKTAAWDESAEDRANVQLSVGSTEETTVSDVVFVLDKSASTDIRQEAMNMLTELRAQAAEGNIIKVGVVNFEQGILDSMQLTELNDANYDVIKKHVIFHDVDSSGTNIQAGVAAGRKMLEADSSVDAANKHLVLVTDGVTYLWGADGTPYSIYSESTANGEENLYASHETIDWHHDASTYYDEFNDMLNWYKTYGAGIAKDMQTYGMVYEAGQYKAVDYDVPQHQGQNTDWSLIDKFEPENSYVPEEDEHNVASAPDAALYALSTEWKQAANEDGFQTYAYADPRYQKDGKYVWAYNAISNLSDFGGYSAALPASKAEYDGMFDQVKSEILYEIASGTVTDVIGSDFDFAGVDTLELTVGGAAAEKVVNGNTVSFNDGDYEVTYDKAADGTETLTWKVNVSVESASPVTLSYALNLANKATEQGTYQVPTNEQAAIDYSSTDGTTGSGEFPVPVLDYTVEAPAPVVVSGNVFGAKKVLTGAELKAGQFSFQLADANGNVVSTATNAADGSITFDDLTFDATGTYEYTVSEVKPADDDPKTAGVQKDGVTYDATVHGVKVEVTEKDGQLVAQVYVPEGGVTFTNAYHAAEAPATGSSAMPKTGDVTNVAALVGTLVGGTGALAAGVALKRRNK